jgi:hypothetical protein
VLDSNDVSIGMPTMVEVYPLSSCEETNYIAQKRGTYQHGYYRPAHRDAGC